MLIYQNRVSIWIDHHEASRAGGAFVCFSNHAHATIFELTLQLSNVGAPINPGWQLAYTLSSCCGLQACDVLS